MAAGKLKQLNKNKCRFNIAKFESYSHCTIRALKIRNKEW